ncbi:MAG TPA: hypothetical protein DD803_15615 [Alcaligenes faecalis]|nr:hypothetical protein [Alcaligenes faecalis]
MGFTFGRSHLVVGQRVRCFYQLGIDMLKLSVYTLIYRVNRFYYSLEVSIKAYLGRCRKFDLILFNIGFTLIIKPLIFSL